MLFLSEVIGFADSRIDAQTFLFVFCNLLGVATKRKLVDKFFEVHRVMHVSKLKCDYGLLKRKAVKLIFQSPIVFCKVYVKFRLKEKFTRIDIIQPEKSRLQFPIDYEAQNSTKVCIFELSVFSARK